MIALVRNTKKESRNYPIRHFRNEKGTRPGMGSGIVTGDLPVIYWPIFLFLVTVPEVFAKVISVQFPVFKVANAYNIV